MYANLKCYPNTIPLDFEIYHPYKLKIKQLYLKNISLVYLILVYI